jgi:hypothetical protein
MLTKARNGRERGAGGAGDEVVQRRWGSFAVRVWGCSSELRIPSRRCAVVLRRWKEIRRTGAGPAARNYGEEQTHRGGAPVEFRGRRGPGSGMAASVVLLGSWRGCCAAWPGLRCGGAVESRRRGGSALAQRMRAWRWGVEVAAVWRG